MIDQDPVVPEDDYKCRTRFDRAQYYVLLPDFEEVNGKRVLIKPSHEFLSSFMQRLRYTETDRTPLASVQFVPESAVGRLNINEANCKGLPLAQFAGLIVHELMHVAKDHVYYDEGQEDPDLWNIACDLEVEYDIGFNYDAQGNLVTFGYPSTEGCILVDRWVEKTRNQSGVFEGVTPDAVVDLFKISRSDIPDGKPAQFYYNVLKKAKQKLQQQQQQQQQQTCPCCGGTGQQHQQQGNNQCQNPQPQQNPGQQSGPGRPSTGNQGNPQPQGNSQNSTQSQGTTPGTGSSQPQQPNSSSGTNQGSSPCQNPPSTPTNGQPSGDSGQPSQSGSPNPSSSGTNPGHPSGSSGQNAPGNSPSNGSNGPNPNASNQNSNGSPSGTGSNASGSGHGSSPASSGGGQGSQTSQGQSGSNPCPMCGGGGQVTTSDMIKWMSDSTGHDQWKDMNEQPSDLRQLTREYAAQLFRDVAEENMSSLPGCLTASYDQAIKILKKEVPWLDKVDEWYGGTGGLKPSINPRRFNKKNLLGRPGFKQHQTVAAILDVSGSVNNTEFGAFMGVVVQLMERNDSEVYVVEIDTEIKGEPYFLSEVGLKEEYSRHGSGGTRLTKAFEHIFDLVESEEARFGGLMVFTDGDLFSWPDPKTVPDNTLWVIVRKTKETWKLPEGMPGEVVYFDLKQKVRERV